MFISFFTTALLTLFSSPVVRAGFSVQTPAFTQCAPVTLSWDNTSGPYDILIANQSNQCGYAVADLGQVTNNSFTWNVTLPAYWTVQISIEDANFDEGWSQAIQVQPSNDHDVSCLPPALAALPNAHAAPSSTSGGRASAKPNKNGALPSTHYQILSYAAVLLSSTIGIITYTIFAAL
ncbi:hypothetical protein V8E52_010050 [Russula decolorans]